MPATDARTIVIMLGGMDGGPLERVLRRALEASALDLAEAALADGGCDGALLLTDAPLALDPPAGLIVETDAEAGHGGPFQYGERLAAAIDRHCLHTVLCAGAGSAPLLDGVGLTALLAPLAAATGERCVTNNRFSADLFALAPAALLARLDPPPAADNAVPRRLHEALGVEVIEVPRTLETQFNIDSPIDLVALRLSGRAHPRLAAMLAEADVEADLEAERVCRAAHVLVDRSAQVLIAGRTSARTWQYLEREAACRVRLLAEERGMQAAGTDVDGSARSLLGQWIAEAGAERAFGVLLPELCDAAFIDIRPALAHLGIRPSRGDRFAADLGRVEAITEPRLRAIVAAANASPVPVVLGGHSLVGGVVQLLTQWAWDARDRLIAR